MSSAPEATVAANQRWFGRWASRYESNPLSGWLTRIQDEALTALELRSDDMLLDVGCGTGVAVRKAAPTVREAVGVDVAPAMVVQARRAGEGLPNVDFVEGDSRELPFEDGTFTALVCTTSFHHYPDPGGPSGRWPGCSGPAGAWSSAIPAPTASPCAWWIG